MTRRSHIFPVACMVAVKFPRSTGPTGVRLERGGGYGCTPLGQCQHGGRGSFSIQSRLPKKAGHVEMEGVGGQGGRWWALSGQ